MAIEFKELIKRGEATLQLGVIDPSQDGVTADVSTIGASIDNTPWVKVGSNDTDWEQVFITEDGSFSANIELTDVSGIVPPANTLGVDEVGNLVMGDGLTVGGKVVGTNEIIDPEAHMLIKAFPETRATRTMLSFENKGDIIINALNTKNSTSWSMEFGKDLKYTNTRYPSMSFAVSEAGGMSITNSLDINIISLDGGGNLTIPGTLSQGSDKNTKENFEAISTQQVLETLASVPVTKWNYIDSETTHMGPMSQDLWQAFGLGQGETTISTVDADGIALASIQALYANQQAMAIELEALRESNALLAERIEQLS